jgi:hypothetical protein
MSCLIGLKGSSFEISIFAFVQRGTSTIMFKIPLLRSAKRGISWKDETTFPFCSMKTRCSVQSVESIPVISDQDIWIFNSSEIAAHQGCWELLQDEEYTLQIGGIRQQEWSAEGTNNL